MGIGGAGFLEKRGRIFVNRGKAVEMFYDSNRDPIVVMPGEARFIETLSKLDIDQFLVDADLYNAQKDVEALLESREHLTLLLDAGTVTRYGDQIMMTIIPKAYKETLEDKVTIDAPLPTTFALPHRSAK